MENFLLSIQEKGQLESSDWGGSITFRDTIGTFADFRFYLEKSVI